MKRSILLFAVSALALLVNAQESPRFYVELSTDSVLMGNYFQVEFILENGNGSDFNPPDLETDFDVVSGPNQSTSMTIMNGQVNQQMRISYYLQPRREGLFYIGPASIVANDQILETEPVAVLVVPNPDGIKQSPPLKNPGFRFEWGAPFFDFEEPMNVFPKNLLPPPAPRDSIPPQPRKKRKTIRI